MGDERERVRRRRQADSKPPPGRAETPAPDEHPLLDVQRRAGNRAASSLADPSGPISRQLASLTPPEAPRPALDRGAEHEADRLAERAVPERGPKARVEPDGKLPPAVRDALAPSVGDLDDVRVHTGPSSTGMAKAMGARAFTDGHDVHVDKDELARPDAARLLAHEAVHAARHGSERAAGGAPLVHAKLMGTHQALMNMGGTQTSSRKRKLIGARKNWEVVLEGVAAYEEMEAALTKRGKVSPTDLAAATPKMLKLLASVEKAALAWQKANGADEAEQVSEQWHAEFKDEGNIQESDTRDDDPQKRGRRQGVAMLLPRVRNEMKLLQSGKWADSLGLSAATLRPGEPLKTDEGQKNVVQELMYTTPDGPFTGYFKEEKGFADKPEGHELMTGIRQADPNYGARAVAMTRLDQLFDINLMAKTEFATHEGKMGTVSESAKGVKAEKVKFAMTEAERQETGADVSLEDSLLQKCLNRMQILDAICGQLDRHFGNFLIQFEDGKATGITGIDLDMAFGQDMETVGDKGATKSMNYVGMPTQVDAELGKRILAVKASDIRAVLDGLLSPKEIEATVMRFEEVKKKVRELAKQGGLTAKWNANTAKETRPGQEGSKVATSYAHSAASVMDSNFAAEFKQTVYGAFQSGDGPEPFRPGLLRRRYVELPENTQYVIRTTLETEAKIMLRPYHWKGQATPEGIHKMAMAMINAVLSDDGLMTKIEMDVMETPPAQTPAVTKRTAAAMRPKFQAMLPGLVRRYGLMGPKIGARR